MKLSIALTFAAVSICLLNAAQAAPETRQKRAVGTEMCPENSTKEECLAYAAAKAKELGGCQHFLVHGLSIEWQSCGVVLCDGTLKLAPGDLSKPYPECCDDCST